MAGRECAAGFGILYELEVFEVRAARKLIMSVHVAIVHEYPGILVDQLEDSSAFYGFGRLLQGLARFAPLRTRRGSALRHKRLCGHLADAAVAFVLVEGVVELVYRVVDDIHVDG